MTPTVTMGFGCVLSGTTDLRPPSQAARASCICRHQSLQNQLFASPLRGRVLSNSKYGILVFQTFLQSELRMIGEAVARHVFLFSGDAPSRSARN